MNGREDLDFLRLPLRRRAALVLSALTLRVGMVIEWRHADDASVYSEHVCMDYSVNG